jgi:hypothetical protein
LVGGNANESINIKTNKIYNFIGFDSSKGLHLVGLEPTIFRLEGERLIHWATGAS